MLLQKSSSQRKKQSGSRRSTSNAIDMPVLDWWEMSPID
jgi:hypothetical protein